MQGCRVCGAPTPVVFNIDFKATPICEGCAQAIFLQQAQWYVEQARTKPKSDPELNCPPQTAIVKNV